MSLGHLLWEAINLMFIGMISVGSFLSILVFIIPLLNKFLPEDPVPANLSGTTTNTAPSQPELIAVISAAVQQYRQKHRE